MASLERRADSYRVVFMLSGKKHGYSLGTAHRPTAEALRGGVEKTLLLIGQGLLACPEGIDIVEFVRSGGKIAERIEVPALERITFGKLCEAYLESQSHGVIESNSLATIKQHLAHLEKTLGNNFRLDKLSLLDVQKHIDRRLQQKYRGRTIGPLTARKEVSAFRTAWNWGIPRGFCSKIFPSKGLLYPKTDAKPPFMTMEEIERKLSAADATKAEKSLYCESLYLRRTEIDALLEYVRGKAAYPWIYPLLSTAAHTGARRSELIRIEVTDLDLERGALLIREKKRSKKQRTTRHVSLSPFLKNVLKDWCEIHPGGRYLFCQARNVQRSRKRSPHTGYRSDPSRSTTSSGRRATLVLRAECTISGLTKDEAHDHFKRTLAGSRWEIIRGFHVLRHSFISCLAAAGIDQRIIDDFVGHSSEEQRRRYRHLIPEVKQQAIATAFG